MVLGCQLCLNHSSELSKAHRESYAGSAVASLGKQQGEPYQPQWVRTDFPNARENI